MGFKLDCYELQEVMKIKYGKNQKKVEDENGEYPILGTGGVMGYANKFLYDKPSVLIGRKGSISKVKYIDKPFWTVDTLFYTEINKNKTLPLYLYYYLSQIDFNYYNEGTTIPSLRTETLNKIEIYLPNIKVQNKIVEYLSNIDKKIELNNKIISNLEQVSQTLFKNWFIDFEFPNEEGKPYKSSGGEMVESELGEIPKGWEVDKLSNIAEIVMGQSPKSETYNNENIGLPLLNGATDFKNRNISPNKYTSDAKKIGKKGDFVFGVRATIGLVTELDNAYAIGRGAGIASSLIKEGKEYLYEILKKAFNEFQYTASGSVYINISKNDLKDYKLVNPTNNITQKYHSIVSAIMFQKENLIQENKNLNQLRDTLLPKLLSGEIEIPDDLEV